MGKDAAKAGQHEALVAKLRDVLAQADASAAAAVTEKTKNWRRNPNGMLADTCGWAYIQVYKPGYRFREALKALNAKARWSGGYWSIPGPSDTGAGQSISASEIACKAACEVLRQHLPEEEFSVSSYVD